MIDWSFFLYSGITYLTLAAKKTLICRGFLVFFFVLAQLNYFIAHWLKKGLRLRVFASFYHSFLSCYIKGEMVILWVWKWLKKIKLACEQCLPKSNDVCDVVRLSNIGFQGCNRIISATPPLLDVACDLSVTNLAPTILFFPLSSSILVIALQIF